MAIQSLTVKQIISRVRQVFPNAPETYIISLINDAINELGQYSQKSMSAKINIVANQRFYTIPKNIIKILDIRAKNHNNASSNYQSIPRSIYEPETEDTDGK